MNHRLLAETDHINFSAFAFRRWAVHYYKCCQDFVNPHKFSPVTLPGNSLGAPGTKDIR